MHIFAADRTAVFIFVFETVVGVVSGDGDAHAAFVTVLKIVFASYTAEPAFMAVEGFFG